MAPSQHRLQPCCPPTARLLLAQPGTAKTAAMPGLAGPASLLVPHLLPELLSLPPACRGRGSKAGPCNDRRGLPAPPRRCPGSPSAAGRRRWSHASNYWAFSLPRVGRGCRPGGGPVPGARGRGRAASPSRSRRGCRPPAGRAALGRAAGPCGRAGRRWPAGRRAGSRAALASGTAPAPSTATPAAAPPPPSSPPLSRPPSVRSDWAARPRQTGLLPPPASSERRCQALPVPRRTNEGGRGKRPIGRLGPSLP